MSDLSSSVYIQPQTEIHSPTAPAFTNMLSPIRVIKMMINLLLQSRLLPTSFIFIPKKLRNVIKFDNQAVQLLIVLMVAYTSHSLLVGII